MTGLTSSMALITLSMASVLYAGVKRWNSPFLRSELFLSGSPKLFVDPGFIVAAITQGHQSQVSDSTVVVELGYSTREGRSKTEKVSQYFTPPSL